MRTTALNLTTWTCQFPLLNSTVCEFAFDQVHIATARQRSVLQQAPAVDPDIFRKAIHTDHNDAVKRTRIVHAVATLSAVDQSSLCRLGAVDSDLCPSCAQCKSSVHHCIWECSHPQLVEARMAVDDENEKTYPVTLTSHPTCLITWHTN